MDPSAFLAEFGAALAALFAVVTGAGGWLGRGLFARRRANGNGSKAEAEPSWFRAWRDAEGERRRERQAEGDRRSDGLHEAIVEVRDRVGVLGERVARLEERTTPRVVVSPGDRGQT